MRTSKLLCKVLANEGALEVWRISGYYKQLIHLGYVEVQGTKISLTRKGVAYAEKEDRKLDRAGGGIPKR